MVQDFRYAVRMLGRSPGFTITAVLVLALAMGANTAIFSVVQAVLLRALPYRDPQRLCVLWKTVPARNIEWDWTSYPTIRDWREQSRSFEDLAVILRPEGSLVVLVSEKIQGSEVTGNFFELLGVAPLLGRTFTRDESERGDNLAVLSHGLWQRRFGGDTAILGRKLQMDGQSATIIGVMPPSFQFPDKTAQIWTLITADSRWAAFQRFRVADAFCALGRLKPGVSIQKASREMNAISARLAQQYPVTDQTLGVRVVPLSSQIAGAKVRTALWVLSGAVLCVLLIACSNIASLQVARGASRSRELAVRSALGAGRGRLLWQLATESILLSLAGGLAGLLFAYGGLRALLALIPTDLPRSDGIGINGTVLAFTFGLCLLTGLAFGLLPASQIAVKDPYAGLHDGGRGASAGPRVSRTRGLLVVAQFCLAIVLLTGAGLLIRSFLLLNAVPPGFDVTHLLTMQVQLPVPKYYDQARCRTFYGEAIRKIEELPGVRGAAVGSAVFDSLKDHVPNQSLIIEGRPPAQDFERHARQFISDGYFRASGIPLRQGRSFASEDVPGSPPVAVINQTMARRYWPSESAIGKRFKQALPGLDGPWMSIVGIVSDAIYNRDGAVVPVFYMSIRQWVMPEFSLVVRTVGDPLSMAAPVRSAVRSLDPAVPYFDISTVENRLEELDRPRRFQTQLIGAFAAIALMLAALGLYGLMSYSVEQRTREFGIRVALGATVGNLVRLVLGQGLRWALAGIAIGIAGALVFGRALSASLFGITATDPLTLATVVGVLTLVAVGACGVPTRRATRVNPTLALRHE